MVFYGYNNTNSTKSLTSDTTLSNYILTIDAYSKIPKLYGMEKIATEKVTDNLDIFQSRFGKIHKFGWWDKKNPAYAGKKFTLMEFEK